MVQNNPIPCPECDRVKYFEGLCNPCRSRKKREHYESMGKEQINACIEKIVAGINTQGIISDDFNGLFAYQDIDTKEIAGAACEKGIFYPPILYRNASEETQNKLIELLLQPTCKDANAILCCLALAGSDKVREVFYQLEKNPLPWRKKLYVDPSSYAEAGGWTFDDRGERIELIFNECYAIVNEKREEREENALKIGEARPECCPVCNCQTVNILTIDGKDERLSFLGLHGTLKIPICPNCASLCEKTIVRYQLDGESTFEIVEPYEDKIYLPAESLKKLTTNSFKLSQTPKPVYFSHGNEEVSTIGGNPVWIQDWQYESCPDCQKKMKLLSAVSWDHVLDCFEGTLYIEICTDCSVAVAFHQQT